MDINRLKIFLEVTRQKSFSRAAENLFLSQPTVSAHIKALEEQLGAPLFNRNYPRIKLAPAGETFLQYAQEIVALQEKALNSLQENSGAATGHLSLAASSVPGAFLLPSILHRFLAEHPAITFSVAERDSAGVVEEILSYHFDVGMIGTLVNDRRLQFTSLAEDELILVAAPGVVAPEMIVEQEEADLPAVYLETLTRVPFLLREAGSATRKVLEKELARFNIARRDLKTIGFWESPQALINSVLLGMGATVVSRRTVEDFLRQNRLEGYYLKDIPVNRKFYLVYLKERTFHPLAESFIKFIENRLP